MEKWKLVVVGLLLSGLIGYGVSQQQGQTPEAAFASVAANRVAPDENKAANFIGRRLGDDQLPEWSRLGPWQNSAQSVTLDSLKGGPALVEFFSIDCPHCQEAAPFMERLYRRYQPRGLKMVAVQSPIRPDEPSRDETQWPKVQKFVATAGLTCAVGMDKGGRYFRQIEGKTWPTTLLADSSGRIIYADTGYKAEKAVSLAVALEKQLPGTGTPKDRAAGLANFLRPSLFNQGKSDAAQLELLTDDLELRLTNMSSVNPKTARP